MVGIARGEDLRFGFQAAKGARVNYAVAVAGIGGAIGMVGFRVTAAAGIGDVHGIRSEGRFAQKRSSHAEIL